MRFITVLALLALAGCSTWYWQQDGKDQADFERDFYGCQVDAAPNVNRRDKQDMMNRCMTLKGWERVKQPNPKMQAFKDALRNPGPLPESK